MNTYYTQRSNPNARTDEDYAMAHVRQGPFSSLDEAQAELVKMIREEAAALAKYSPERSATFQVAASTAQNQLLTRIEIEGLLFNVYKV